MENARYAKLYKKRAILISMKAMKDMFRMKGKHGGAACYMAESRSFFTHHLRDNTVLEMTLTTLNGLPSFLAYFAVAMALLVAFAFIIDDLES